MDMKIIAIGVAAVILLAAVGLFIMGQAPSETSRTAPATAEKTQDDGKNIGIGMNEIATAEVTKVGGSAPAPVSTGTTHTVEMSSSGFSPDSLTVKAGDTVTFLAVDGAGRWPASAVHPTHTVYPGSGIQKCSTSEKDSIFDACGGVPNGQSWSFKFDEKGSWNYHDHLDSKVFGKIIVE
jgi:plastocyanin